MADTCEDCGRQKSPREVITKGWHKNPEHCGARLHPCWTEECAGRTIIRLRTELAAVKEKLAACESLKRKG